MLRPKDGIIGSFLFIAVLKINFNLQEAKNNG